MVRNARMALLATAAVVFANTAAQAGSTNAYNSGATVPVVSYTEPVQAAPQIQPYYEPAPVVDAGPKEGYYDESKGNNQDFGYAQSHACGGALDGANCLVILHDHMRRVRLERDAGTILVGNPTIADVTVLGKDTIFVSARSIGATNIIVLDEDNNEITTFEVFVREPKTKRVVLRNAGAAEAYQCAPDCLRALSQSDAPAAHSQALSVISADSGLDQTSIGAQSGSNPNTDPSAIPSGQTNAPAAPTSGVGQIGDAVAPALGALLGTSAPAAPVNTAPPPATPN